MPNCVSRIQTPDQRDHRCRHHVRREKQGACEAGERPALIDEQGEGERQDGDAGHDHRGVDQGVGKGVPDPLVGKCALEIGKPDPFRRADDAPVGKADIDAEQDRPDVEQHERQGEEGDEHIADPIDPAAMPGTGGGTAPGTFKTTISRQTGRCRRIGRTGSTCGPGHGPAVDQPMSRSACHFSWIFSIASSIELWPTQTPSRVLARKLSPE